jgi:hypothetical protein
MPLPPERRNRGLGLISINIQRLARGYSGDLKRNPIPCVERVMGKGESSKGIAVFILGGVVARHEELLRKISARVKHTIWVTGRSTLPCSFLLHLSQPFALLDLIGRPVSNVWVLSCDKCKGKRV